MSDPKPYFLDPEGVYVSPFDCDVGECVTANVHLGTHALVCEGMTFWSEHGIRTALSLADRNLRRVQPRAFALGDVVPLVALPEGATVRPWGAKREWRKEGGTLRRVDSFFTVLSLADAARDAGLFTLVSLPGGASSYVTKGGAQ